MIPKSCLVIETNKFPILDGEDEEIINERMYGKALCQYLALELPQAGIKVPAFCNEDWGWCLEVVHNNFKMALCIYSAPDAPEHPQKYALLPSIHTATRWSWRRLRQVDLSEGVLQIMNIVEEVFKKDPEIAAVTRHDGYPF